MTSMRSPAIRKPLAKKSAPRRAELPARAAASLPKKRVTPVSAAIAPTLIDESVSLQRQGVEANRTVDVRGRKLHMVVYADSYAFQSHAKIELWDPQASRWNTVYTIPYALMKTPTGRLNHLPDNKGVHLSHFEADLSQLLDTAVKIVF